MCAIRTLKRAVNKVSCLRHFRLLSLSFHYRLIAPQFFNRFGNSQVIIQFIVFAHLVFIITGDEEGSKNIFDKLTIYNIYYCRIQLLLWKHLYAST
jgi:hypothetical protein